MVQITIGTYSSPLDRIDKNWIENAFKASGRPCVQVSVQGSGVDLALSSGLCQTGGGGCRTLTKPEEAIVDAWVKNKMSSMEYTATEFIDFLNDLNSLV